MTSQLSGTYYWFIFLLMGFNLSAQKPLFERLTTRQGLSQLTVNCMWQDQKGFLWVGTQNGLNRFDGYEFKTFESQVGNPVSLINNNILTIYEDREGFLWLGTPEGLDRFDPTSESCIHYQSDPADPQSLAFNQVNAILEDHSGNLWVGSSTSLDKLDRESGKFFHFPVPYNLPVTPGHLFVRQIVEFDNHLYLATWGEGLLRFDPKNSTFQRIFADQESFNNRTWIEQIRITRDGILWTSAEGSIFRFDPARDSFFHEYGIKTHTIPAFHQLPSGKFMAGTSARGLIFFEPGKSSDFRYLLDPDTTNQYNNFISSILETRDGVIWLGTMGNGLFRFDPERKKFELFRQDHDPGSDVESRNIQHILETRTGEIWTASRSTGIQVFDRTSGTFQHIGLRKDIPPGLKTTQIRCLFQDAQGWIWVGTWGDGIKVFDPDTGNYYQYLRDPNDPESLPDNFISSICEDKYHRLWFATQNGVASIEPEKKSTGSFSTILTEGSGLSHLRTTCVFSDHQGLIWIGTLKGLNRYDPASQEIKVFQREIFDDTSLGSNYVNCIYEDSKLRLWIGTAGGGLNLLDRNRLDFSHFSTHQGLQRNVVQGIVEDAKGFLWVTTDLGLATFEPDKAIFTNFFNKGDLPDDQFNPGSLMISPSTGEIFAGGKDGFVFFHPDNIVRNDFVPPIVVASLTYFEMKDGTSHQSEIKSISNLDQLTLPASSNTLVFKFAALSFKQTQNNQYAYKLEGLNENWNHLGTTRELTFHQLPPGSYTLHVKGSNNDGIWNEEGISLKLQILPPWYLSWWAYLTYILLGMGLIIFFRNKELQSQRLKYSLELEQITSRKLKEIDELKSRFFTNISHEFRTPLTLILGQVDSSLDKVENNVIRNKLEMALRNGKRLLRLINQILDLSKLEAGEMSLHASPHDVIPFLKNIFYSFSSLAEQKRIELDFQPTISCQEAYFDRDKLEKVFINLVSNALKFTKEGGKVTLKIEIPMKGNARGDTIQISIQDTGIGIPPVRLPYIFDRFYQVEDSGPAQEKGTGVGLELVRQYIGLHHGSIDVASEEGVGTVFKITLSLGHRHFKPEEIGQDSSGMVNGSFNMESSWIMDELKQSSHQTDNEQETPTHQKSGTARLLVVEDNADIRSYLSEHLKENGYSILEAGNGQVGLDLACEHQPDLILSDVLMPVMDGYELCNKLREDQRTSHIPIIMLTAKAGEEDKIEGLVAGVDDYLVKPFSSKELLARVANLIRIRRSLRERFSRETTIAPGKVSAIPADQAFLEKVIQTIEANIPDESFNVESLSVYVHMSVTHLNRKLNALLGQTAGHLIRSMRLQCAADLLMQEAGTAREIAFQTGHVDPALFSKNFKKQFGCTPMKYRAMKISTEK